MKHKWNYSKDENGPKWECNVCGTVYYVEPTYANDCQPGIEEKTDVHPNETQVGGDHYKSKGIQPWDYIAANNLGYFEGNAVKYVSRWRDKGGVEDLRKAIHYIEKLISIELDNDDD